MLLIFVVDIRIFALCIQTILVDMCNELGVVEVKVTQAMNRHNPLKV